MKTYDLNKISKNEAKQIAFRAAGAGRKVSLTTFDRFADRLVTIQLGSKVNAGTRNEWTVEIKDILYAIDTDVLRTLEVE